jgi:hypothetical protein
MTNIFTAYRPYITNSVISFPSSVKKDIKVFFRGDDNSIKRGREKQFNNLTRAREAYKKFMEE